ETGRSEWPFAEGVAPTDEWPVMGCGNLIRRTAWERAGGYCEAFFLYRNDADLAMTLLEAGWGVHFDASLVVVHDSPGATRKSERWFQLATRNWIWLCRRHGRGLSGIIAGVLGVARAHRLAGRSVRGQIAVVKGAALGLWKPAPAPPPG